MAGWATSDEYTEKVPVTNTRGDGPADWHPWASPVYKEDARARGTLERGQLTVARLCGESACRTALDDPLPDPPRKGEGEVGREGLCRCLLGVRGAVEPAGEPGKDRRRRMQRDVETAQRDDSEQRLRQEAGDRQDREENRHSPAVGDGAPAEKGTDPDEPDHQVGDCMGNGDRN